MNDSQDGYYNIFSLKKDGILEELKEDVSEVYLRIPTFQIRSELNVVDYLKKLGVQKVFESGAELDELGMGQLSVSKISHLALMEVSSLRCPRRALTPGPLQAPRPSYQT